jgi:hypothetical protein
MTFYEEFIIPGNQALNVGVQFIQTTTHCYHFVQPFHVYVHRVRRSIYSLELYLQRCHFY